MKRLCTSTGLGLLFCTLMLTGCASPNPISFPATDVGVVYADQYGSGDQTLVLCHGMVFNKESWATQAQAFADAGFKVLAIDFRGRGQSKGPNNESNNEDAHHDVLGAVNYLREHGAKTVSVVGASFGGWAASTAAVSAPGSIDRIVLLASAVDEPEKLTGRKLFILARDDGRTDTGSRLERVQREFDATDEPKELVILEGSAHAQFLFETDQGDQLMAEMIRFLTAP
jgi:alpha/beta superfamily hydrolase